MLIEVADVLARDDVDLRVPVFIKRAEHLQLSFLLGRDVGEIFEYLFHFLSV